MTQQQFLKLLFEPGQRTCFSPDIYGTSLASAPGPSDVFFCVNALHTSRLDSNVICYRNLLLELDKVPLQQQVALVTSRVPVSAITFSGGKSYHFIISLTEPVATEADYRRAWRGLYEAVPEADKACKNPSRLSRLPQVLRPDTGLMQELLYLGSHVPLAELPQPKPLKEAPAPSSEKLFVTQQLLRVLEIGVDTYIAGSFAGRNQFFYWLGKRCSELGHTRAEKRSMVDKFYNRMENKRGFSITEAYSAARVAN